MTDEDEEMYLLGVAATARMMLGGSVDEYILDCPACGERQLRAEAVEEWRSVSSVATQMQTTEAALLADTRVRRDTFGRMLCAIPYVTCMACGFHADATLPPPTTSNRSHR